MRIKLATAATALALLLPGGPALALDASVSSSTFLSLRESVGERHIAPVYEYLDINVKNIVDTEVSLHANGWLRVDLADEWAGDEFEGELSYAYLSLGLTEKGFMEKAFLNLGRVFVFEGAVTEPMDGAYAKADLPNGFGVSVFGGAPVEGDSGSLGADAIYGARLSRQGYGVYSIGTSYLKQDGDADKDEREEQGIDLWLRPAGIVEVQGLSAYSYNTSGWMEHAYRLTLGPYRKLRLNGAYSFVNYEHFFSSPTLDVFSATQLDPAEEMQTAGGSVDYAFSGQSMTVTLEYKHHEYDIKGDATLYGGTLSYAREGYLAGLSVHRMDGETEDLEYYQYRAYASKKFGRLDATLDFFDVGYDKAINDVEHAFAVVAAFGYVITPKARAGVDFEYARNPFFDDQFKAFFKLLYTFEPGV
jgi:hypothetical protein